MTSKSYNFSLGLRQIPDVTGVRYLTWWKIVYFNIIKTLQNLENFN